MDLCQQVQDLDRRVRKLEGQPADETPTPPKYDGLLPPDMGYAGVWEPTCKDFGYVSAIGNQLILNKTSLPVIPDCKFGKLRQIVRKALFPRFFRWTPRNDNNVMMFDSPSHRGFVICQNGQVFEHTCMGPFVEWWRTYQKDPNLHEMTYEEAKQFNPHVPAQKLNKPEYQLGQWVAIHGGGDVAPFDAVGRIVKFREDGRIDLSDDYCDHVIWTIVPSDIKGLCPDKPKSCPAGYEYIGCSEWKVGDIWTWGYGICVERRPLGEVKTFGAYPSPNYELYKGRVWKIRRITPYAVKSEDGYWRGWAYSVPNDTRTFVALLRKTGATRPDLARDSLKHFDESHNIKLVED